MSPGPDGASAEAGDGTARPCGPGEDSPASADAAGSGAAGCAVVLKPASQTPMSALLLAELMTEAGLPPGWLNVVTGPAAEIGDVLVEDERVKLITFTGSSDVGWKLRERAARKKVALELGNATPVIVEADADIEEAATKLAANAFAFAGQSCISVQRIYVQQAVYDALGVLTDAGLIRRIHPPGSVARYESRVGDNHHHVVCRACGAIADVDCAVGEAPCLTADDTHGFVIDEAEVIYWGVCPACHTKGPRA